MEKTAEQKFKRRIAKSDIPKNNIIKDVIETLKDLETILFKEDRKTHLISRELIEFKIKDYFNDEYTRDVYNDIKTYIELQTELVNDIINYNINRKNNPNIPHLVYRKYELREAQANAIARAIADYYGKVGASPSGAK